MRVGQVKVVIDLEATHVELPPGENGGVHQVRHVGVSAQCTRVDARAVTIFTVRTTTVESGSVHAVFVQSFDYAFIRYVIVGHSHKTSPTLIIRRTEISINLICDDYC